MVFDRISKMVEDNHSQGLYDHADNNAPNRKGSRPRKKPDFFHDQAIEHKAKPTKRRRSRRRKRANDDSDEDDEINQIIPYRKTNVFEDSSDESESEIAVKNHSIMKRRKQNLELENIIDYDVDLEGSRKPDIRSNRQYRSTQDGGNDFSLIEEMKRVEAQDDDSSSVEIIRNEVQTNFDNQQIERRNELAMAQLEDRMNMTNEPLFDAELSDDEEEKTDPNSVSVGNVTIHGSNNNISLTVVKQPQREERSHCDPMQMYHSGFRGYHYGGSQGYGGNQAVPYGYDIMPRFLMHRNMPVPMIAQRHSIEMAIKTKLASLNRTLPSSESSWIDRLLAVARRIDDGNSTVRDSDWVNNQRRSNIDEWKRSFLNMLL